MLSRNSATTSDGYIAPMTGGSTVFPKPARRFVYLHTQRREKAVHEQPSAMLETILAQPAMRGTHVRTTIK